MRRTKTLAALFIASVSLSGCEQTSDVLVFATDTKVALDISGDPTGAPSVTLGYKRREAVWMPLASERERNADGTPEGASQQYVGNDTNDAYSVLGSFGLEQDGDGASIAQYFATGHAARELARRGGAALVNTQELPPELLAMAAERQVEVNRQIEIITNAVVVDGVVDPTKWSALLQAAGHEDDEDLAALSGKPEQDLVDELNGSSDWALNNLETAVN